MYSKILKNALANWGGFFITLIVGFLMSPFLVRTLGDVRYGIWSLISNVSGYLLLLEFGIGSSLTRYVSKYYKNFDRKKLLSITNSALFLYILLAALTISISPFLASVIVRVVGENEHLNQVLKPLTVIVAINVSFLLVNSGFRGILQGLQRYDVINLMSVFVGLCQAALFYVMLSNGHGLLTMALISVGNSVLLIVISYAILRKKYAFIEYSFKNVSREGLRKVSAYSLFTFVNMIANQLSNYTDSFVIAYFLPLSMVTYYSIAWTLTEYVKKFCSAFSWVFIPVISELEAVGNKKKIQELAIRGTKFILIVSNLFFIGLLVFGKPFIALWMGEKYAVLATPILNILIASQFFAAPQLVSGAIFFGMSKHKVTSLASLFAAILNFGLSILLVQTYELAGVALGTSISQFLLYGLFYPYYLNRLLGHRLITYFKDTYGKVLLPGVFLFFMLKTWIQYLYPVSYSILLVEAASSASIYFVLIYKYSLTQKEKDTLRTAVLPFFQRKVKNA